MWWVCLLSCLHFGPVSLYLLYTHSWVFWKRQNPKYLCTFSRLLMPFNEWTHMEQHGWTQNQTQRGFLMSCSMVHMAVANAWMRGENVAKGKRFRRVYPQNEAETRTYEHVVPCPERVIEGGHEHHLFSWTPPQGFGFSCSLHALCFAGAGKIISVSTLVVLGIQAHGWSKAFRSKKPSSDVPGVLRTVKEAHNWKSTGTGCSSTSMFYHNFPAKYLKHWMLLKAIVGEHGLAVSIQVLSMGCKRYMV